jgi:hypothetical protein
MEIRGGDSAPRSTRHARGGNIVLALMSAAEGKQAECQQYAWEEGAPILFAIQQPRQVARTAKPNTRVMMVGGVGEVPAGTFKTKRELE